MAGNKKKNCVSKEMREAVKNSGHRKENHATEEAKRKITTKEFQTREARKQKGNNSKNNRREKYLVLNHWRWFHFSVDGNSASLQFFSSSAISTGPTGAGGARSLAIEEKGWCRLTVTQNAKKLPTPERRQNNSD